MFTKNNLMEFQLKFYLMCGRDGSVSDKLTTKKIKAKSDEEAIKTANKFLKNEYQGTTLKPWAPMLYKGEFIIAAGEAIYPPRAHYLSWDCKAGKLVEI